MVAAVSMRAVLVAPSARRDVEHYEGRSARSGRVSLRLTPEERGDLFLSWGGYEHVSGCRSAFGSILDAALRAPPRDRPVRDLIVAELQRRGGRLAIDDLASVIEKEGMATRHEVRRAVRGMVGAGWLSQYLQELPKTRQEVNPETGETETQVVHLLTPCVRLEARPKQAFPDTLTPAERWRREDEELRRYCLGDIPCHESRSTKAHDAVPRSGAPPAARVRLLGLDRCILERVYGTSTHPPYRDVFGADVAAVVEYTDAARAAQVARALPTMAETLRAVLDVAPESALDAARWRAERERFVREVKAQGARLIDNACEAFRAARNS